MQQDESVRACCDERKRRKFRNFIKNSKKNCKKRFFEIKIFSNLLTNRVSYDIIIAINKWEFVEKSMQRTSVPLFERNEKNLIEVEIWLTTTQPYRI